MWIYFVPILSAIGLGAGTTLEKVVLRKRKIGSKIFQAAAFLAIVLVMIPFLYFFWKVDSQALSFTNILIMAGVVIGSVLANVFALYALKWDKINHIEPARLVEPLFTILLAIVFSFIFGEALYERNMKIIGAALVAGAALIFSHIRKHHLEFNKYFIAAILGSFFFALELVVSRLILDYYSPLSFYFIRSFFVFVVSFVIFRPKFSRIDKKARWEILIASAIWVFYRIMLYYGYIELGVIFTTLILMLGPLFIYLFAWKWLKEKLDWRNITASAIIIASVFYALLF